LDTAALRIARDASGAVPSLLEQAGALGGSKRHPDQPNVAITYFGLVPDASGARKSEWVPLADIAGVTARAREQIDLALAVMRARVDQQPIAFRLLPAAFTLSELQSVYELLLGRRLHKASFRRSLHASALVEPTDEWRSEGRGRPAQLFRYAPPRRRRQRRGIRFDLLS
jgi:8-oxo-dGTP diphosphatase